MYTLKFIQKGFMLKSIDYWMALVEHAWFFWISEILPTPSLYDFLKTRQLELFNDSFLRPWKEYWHTQNYLIIVDMICV